MKEAFDNDKYLLAYVNRPTLHDRINVRGWLEGVASRLLPYWRKRRRKPIK